MSGRQLPLLCQNTTEYGGPFVPTNGLRGHVRAEGLTPQDKLAVFGYTIGAQEVDLGTLVDETLGVIFDPKQYVYVRAVRFKSSGKPIDVWVD